MFFRRPAPVTQGNGTLAVILAQGLKVFAFPIKRLDGFPVTRKPLEYMKQTWLDDRHGNGSSETPYLKTIQRATIPLPPIIRLGILFCGLGRHLGIE